MTLPLTQSEIDAFRARVTGWSSQGVPYGIQKAFADRIIATLDSLAALCPPAKEPTSQDVFTMALAHTGGYLEQIAALQKRVAELERAHPHPPEFS